MQITLGHEDVQKALYEYVKNQGINVEGKTVTFNIIAGRRGNGTKVEVFLTSDSDEFLTENAPEAAVEVEADTPVEVQEVVETVDTDKVETSAEPASLFGT